MFGRFLAVATIMLATVHLYAERTMITKENSGILSVKNKFYKLDFFPGYMLPFRVYINNKKIKLTFLDRLYDSETQRQYFLSKDRFSELKIVSNRSNEATVTASGTYVMGDEDEAPGNIKAEYKYTFHANSPVIDVAASIYRNDQKKWTQLLFLQPAWKDTPFPEMYSGNGEKRKNILAAGKNKKFKRKKWIILGDGMIAIGVGGRDVFAWNNFNRKYYSYICRKEIYNWSDKKTQLNGKLLFSPVVDSEFSSNRLNNSETVASRPVSSAKNIKEEVKFILQSGKYSIVIGYNFTIRKIIYDGCEIGADTGWYGTIFAPENQHFIGAGHNEGGVEKVLSQKLSVNGKTEKPVSGKKYSGRVVNFEKVSMLGNLKVNMNIKLSGDEISIVKNFEAVAKQKAASMYIFQFCWNREITDWMAELDNGKVIQGKLAGIPVDRFVLNKPAIKYLAEYSNSLKKGVIMYYDIPYSVFKNTIWNRKFYKKFYMMLKVPDEYKQGYKSETYKIRLRCFSSEPGNWVNKVKLVTSEMK